MPELPNWTIYVKAFRDPTMKDVEDRAREIGARFWKEELRHSRLKSCRRYMLDYGDGRAHVVLQTCQQGERPDWRAMLKFMGSDWV